MWCEICSLVIYANMRYCCIEVPDLYSEWRRLLPLLLLLVRPTLALALGRPGWLAAPACRSRRRRRRIARCKRAEQRPLHCCLRRRRRLLRDRRRSSDSGRRAAGAFDAASSERRRRRRPSCAAAASTASTAAGVASQRRRRCAGREKQSGRSEIAPSPARPTNSAQPANAAPSPAGSSRSRQKSLWPPLEPHVAERRSAPQLCANERKGAGRTRAAAPAANATRSLALWRSSSGSVAVGPQPKGGPSKLFGGEEHKERVKPTARLAPEPTRLPPAHNNHRPARFNLDILFIWTSPRCWRRRRRRRRRRQQRW